MTDDTSLIEYNDSDLCNYAFNDSKNSVGGVRADR